MVTRVLDLAIVLLLAVMVLMPRPDARATAAAELDGETRARVAELQAQLLSDPGAVEPSIALGELFMDAKRPEWAIAALSAALERAAQDHRVHHWLALAYADHFVAGPAHEAAVRALALCDGGSSAPCGPAARTRIELLASTLERVKDIDMRKNPNAAKVNITRGLRPMFLPKPKPAAKAPAPASPATSEPAPGAGLSGPR